MLWPRRHPMMLEDGRTADATTTIVPLHGHTLFCKRLWHFFFLRNNSLSKNSERVYFFFAWRRGIRNFDDFGGKYAFLHGTPFNKNIAHYVGPKFLNLLPSLWKFPWWKSFVRECSRAHQHPKDAGGVTHHCVKSFRLVLATNAKVGFALEKKSLGSWDTSTPTTTAPLLCMYNVCLQLHSAIRRLLV